MPGSIANANFIQPTVTINGATYRGELIVSDNESSKAKAPNAATNLVDHDVALVLGSCGSDESLAGSSVFEDAGIPVVGVNCTTPAITAGNQHDFRICWLDTFQGSALANFAAEYLNAGTVYCLAEREDNYSAGLCSYFMESFTSLGGSFVYETYPAGTTDFIPCIRAAQHAGAKILFAPGPHCGLSPRLEKRSWVAGDTWDSNVVAAAGRNTNQDIYVTTFMDENARNYPCKQKLFVL